MTQSIEEKRKERKKATAEDFTPSWLVNQMLDKLNEYGPESWEPNKTFLDPACGNGNMLVCVLERKITLGHEPTGAIDSIYGTDIMQDNIKECRLRLLKVLKDNNVEITEEHIKSVFNNIVCTPLNKYKNGSLDYDFCFHKKAKPKNIKRWKDGIKNHNWIELIGYVNINRIIANDVEASTAEEALEEIKNKFHSFF
jgi:hypothetical protein